MKIDSARANNKARCFVLTSGDKTLTFPFEWAEVVPTSDDPIDELFIDSELASQAVTYRLRSGAEGFVHWEQALDYNCDPGYLRSLQLYLMTAEAQRRMSDSRLSKREVARRLGTSPTQLYRLLDPTNGAKTLDSMFELLTVLGADVEFSAQDSRRVHRTESELLACEGSE